MSYDVPVTLEPLASFLILLVVLPLGVGVPLMRRRPHAWKAYTVGILVLGAVFGVGRLAELTSPHVLTIADRKITVTTPRVSYSASFDELDVAGAAVIEDLASLVRLRRRTNAIGLPGYRVGWYATSSGRAFVAATKPPFLYVPSRAGDLVVSLSAADAEAAARAIREAR